MLEKPTEKHRIIDLVSEAGVDVSNWAIDRDGGAVHCPASNPHYCYEWTHSNNKKKKIVLCLWYDDIVDGQIKLNFKDVALLYDDLRKGRAERMDFSLRKAHRTGCPVRMIIKLKFSHSLYRYLDDKPWRVTRYNKKTGKCVVVRDE